MRNKLVKEYYGLYQMIKSETAASLEMRNHANGRVYLCNVIPSLTIAALV